MNRLRLLMFGLLLLVLSGGGYFVLSQVRPSADTTETASQTPTNTTGVNPPPDCPQVTPNEMPSYSWSNAGWTNDYSGPLGSYETVDVAYGPGTYRFATTRKTNGGIHPSTGAEVGPSESSTSFTINAPATVKAGEEFSVTFMASDIAGGSVTQTYKAGEAGTVMTLTPGGVGNEPLETYLAPFRLPQESTGQGLKGGVYVIGSDGPRTFSVDLKANDPAFLGIEKPAATFTATSSLAAMGTFQTSTEGLAAEPREVLLGDIAKEVRVTGPTLKPGAVQVGVTAKEGCGGTAEAQKVGYAYDLKLFTEKPTASQEKPAELEIGIDGWTQIKEQVQKDEFKQYFADKAWQIKLLGRESAEGEYQAIGGFEAGSDKAALVASDEDGIVTQAFTEATWGTEGKQPLFLELPKDLAATDLKLRLILKGTDAAREFPLTLVIDGNLLLERNADARPQGEIDSDDEDEVAPLLNSQEEAEQAGEPVSWRKAVTDTLARFFSRNTTTAQAQEGALAPRAAVGSRVFIGESVVAAINVPRQQKPGAYTVTIAYPKELPPAYAESELQQKITTPDWAKVTAVTKKSETELEVVVVAKEATTDLNVIENLANVPFIVRGDKEARTVIKKDLVIKPEVTFVANGQTAQQTIRATDVSFSVAPIGESTLKLVKVEFDDPVTGERKHQPEPGKPDEFTIYPGATLSYEARVPAIGDDLEAFKSFGLVATADITSQAATVSASGNPTVRERGKDKDGNPFVALDWQVADAEFEGSEAVFRYDVVLKEEIPAAQLTVGSRFYVYDQQEQLILTGVREQTESPETVLEGVIDQYLENPKISRTALFVEHPLWLAAQGNVKTVFNDPLPYISIAASGKDLSVQKNKDGGLTIVDHSEREKLARTRTKEDGTYALRAPRARFSIQKKAGVADGEEVTYETRPYLEFVNDEHEYDYAYIVNKSWTPEEDPDHPSRKVVQPEAMRLDAVPFPMTASFVQDFDFTKAPESIEGMDQFIWDAIKSGTHVMRLVGLTKHYTEDKLTALKPAPVKHMLGEYTIHALPTQEALLAACKFPEGSTIDGCSTKASMKIGPGAWEPDALNMTTQLVFHEWAHHLHAYLDPNMEEGQESLVDARDIAGFGLAKVPQNFDASILGSHQGLMVEQSIPSVSEGFADFMGVFLDRKFGDKKDDWFVANEGVLNIAFPLPIFAGLANGPNQVNKSAAPIVFVSESEEQAVKTFFKWAVADRTTYTEETVWWAGLPERSYTWAPPGASEEERLISVLQALRSARRFPELITAYLAQVGITDAEQRSYTYRLFGLFNDLNCNWRYDEWDIVREEVAKSGTSCPFVARHADFQDKGNAQERGWGSSDTYGARPWRDNKATEVVADSSSRDANLLSFFRRTEEATSHAYTSNLAGAAFRVVGWTPEPDEAPRLARVTYRLPEEYGQDPISVEYPLASSGTEIPLSPYPPVVNSEITLEVEGVAQPALTIAGDTYWQSLASDKPTSIVSTYDPSTAPPVSDEPIVVDVAGDDTPLTEDGGELPIYVDPDFEGPVDGQEPPAGIGADNVVVTLKDPNGQDATTNLHIRYARVRAEGVETLSNETVAATGEFAHQLRFGSTGADEYLVITADGSDNRFFLTAARNEEVRVERGDDTGPRFGMPFLVNGQATPSPDELLRLEQQRLFPAPTNRSGPTPEPYVDPNFQEPVDGAGQPVPYIDPNFQQPVDGQGQPVPYVDPNFQQPPPEGFQPAPVYASDTVVVRTETPEHSLAPTTLHLQYARVTADRIEPLYETTFQSNGEFAHQLRFSSTDANEYLVITADGSDNRFFISGARNEEVRLERGDAQGARFWTNFNVNGQQAPAIADLLRMEQQRFAAPPPVTVDGTRPLMPGECRVVNDMVTECAIPSGDVVDGEEIVRLDLDGDGNTAETPNEALNLPTDAFAPQPFPEGEPMESGDEPLPAPEPIDPAELRKLTLRTVGDTGLPAEADIQLRYVRWNRIDEPAILREELLASADTVTHDIRFETKEPVEFLVATASGSSTSFVMVAEQYANYQQRLIEGRYIPLPFHEFRIDGGTPAPLADILRNFEESIAARPPQPVEDGGFEQIVKIPLLQPYYDPAISFHNPCQDDGLDHEDELSEDDIPNDGGAIEEDACATVDGDKLYFTAGGFLTVATSEFIPGEVVDIQIDGELVAEDQLIPADGAELMVALPEDLSDGEHQLEVERIDGAIVAGAFQVKSGFQLEWLVLLAGVLGLLWLALKLIRRRPTGGGTPTISVSMTPPRPMAPGAMLLLLVTGVLGLQYADLAQAALQPVLYTMRPGEVYVPPGIAGGADPASANRPYRNPLYLRDSGTDTDHMWGTVGTVALAQRFAGEWMKRHPEEIVVFNDLGIRGGGPWYTWDNKCVHSCAGAHSDGRAIDFWTIRRSDGLSRIINDPVAHPADTALYDSALAAEVVSVLTSLTGGQHLIYFKPKGGTEEAARLGVTYEEDHGNHWHIQVPLNFQGPPPDKTTASVS